MAASLVELHPNRRLLDHEFEGYKLNLTNLPHFSHKLEDSVDKVYPAEQQYSFVHAKLFALHNHLIPDYWGYSLKYYYFDKKQQVRQITFDNVTNTLSSSLVYDVPAHVPREPGHFNLCLSFPSSNLAVVSDGTGFIHIVDTGNRDENKQWETMLSSHVLGKGRFFIIMDTILHEINNVESLHCLLQHVEQKETEQKESTFNSILSWVTYIKAGKSWKQNGLKRVEGKGPVHYAAIETSCNALYVASDHPFKFTADSEKVIPIEPPKKEPKTTYYHWLQTLEDLTVTLQLPKDYDKSLFHVDVTPFTIKVTYGNNTYLDGKLKHKIDIKLTTWLILNNGEVNILLTKYEPKLWDGVLEAGDPHGEEVMDHSLVEEAHRRLAHLCSETPVVADSAKPAFSTQELEECDAASEEDTVLVRFQTDNHQITHRIPLSVNQFLFSLKLETNQVPALALRHDVDACIWQPYAQLVNSETWPLNHLGTLLAFGYVQSSKTDRKFVTCPPNFSYSVVCESSRHIFIYKRRSDDSELRKRTGDSVKTVKVGHQHVFNIESFGEVFGIHATNNYLFVLTENNFVVINVHET